MRTVLSSQQLLFFKDLFRFLSAGIPMMLVAVALNALLVTRFSVSIPIAYGFVLVLQTSVNFFVCRDWVFKSERQHKNLNLFATFFVGILFIRFIDWGIYHLMTSQLQVHFLIAQFINIGVFSIIKFKFSQRLFKNNPQPDGVKRP